MNTDMEQRTLEIRDISTVDNVMKVSGYVNKNGSKSEILSEDGVVFQETILPQAFTNALSRGNEICFFLEHDPSKILATTKNNTLEVTQDGVGLHMSATIVKTTDGTNAYNLIKSGIITNMSFGFLVNNDLWNTDGDIPLRTVTDLDLLEVSAVKNPAYQSSTISARSKKDGLLDKSKINFRDKGGVKNMELSNFSIKDLKEELAKRSADEPKEEKESVDEPKEEVEQHKESEEVSDEKLSERDWYNLVMTVCRTKGVVPTEKRDGEDVVSEPVEKPTDEPIDEPEETETEEPKDSEEPKEDSKEEESEKEDSEDVKDESEKEDSESEEKDAEHKEEEPETTDEDAKEVEDGERSVKEDFSDMEELLKPFE